MNIKKWSKFNESMEQPQGLLILNNWYSAETISHILVEAFNGVVEEHDNEEGGNIISKRQFKVNITRDEIKDEILEIELVEGDFTDEEFEKLKIMIREDS